jgi:6-phosphogluconolactonase (cycloisomerase 2 family)
MPSFSFLRKRPRRLAMLGMLIAVAATGHLGCVADDSARSIAGTQYAYVTNSGDNTVTVYQVDGNSGALKSLGTVAVGKTPVKVATANISLTENYVYVLNRLDSTVSQFKVNANGTLMPLSPPTVSVGASPSDIIFGLNRSGDDSANFHRIYVSSVGDGTLSIFHINNDGTLRVISTVHGLDTPSAISSIGPDYALNYTGSGSSEETVTYLPHELDKGLVVASRNANTVTEFEVVPDDAGGLKLHAPTVSTGSGPAGVAATTNAIFTANEGSGNISVYSHNLRSNTALTLTGSTALSTPTHPISIVTAPGSRIGDGTTEYLYVGTSEGQIYQFNASGRLVAKASLGDVTTPPVPPIVVPAEQISLKFHGHHLYVVQPGENQITAYEQIRPLLTQNYVEATSAQTFPTGKTPTAMAFLDMSATVGSIQTGIK